MEYRDGKKEITGHEQKTKGSFNGIHLGNEMTSRVKTRGHSMEYNEGMK